MEQNPDIYLIHPVTEITSEEKEFLDNYVFEIEKKGYKVHYPIRDVNQDDELINIYKQHRKAMDYATEVHIYWTRKSSGSIFDFGMGFMSNKRIVLINKEKISKTPHKSFENVLLDLHQESLLG